MVRREKQLIFSHSFTHTHTHTHTHRGTDTQEQPTVYTGAQHIDYPDIHSQLRRMINAVPTATQEAVGKSIFITVIAIKST